MRNQNYYTEDLSTVLMEDVIEPTPTKRGLSTLLSSRAGSLMLQDAAMTAGRLRCHALLAQTAMENTAALAIGAERLGCIAPHGSQYYQAILAAYANKAVEKIGRW